MDIYGTIMIAGVNPKSLAQLETAIEAVITRSIRAKGISVKLREASRAGATTDPDNRKPDRID